MNEGRYVVTREVLCFAIIGDVTRGYDVTVQSVTDGRVVGFASLPYRVVVPRRGMDADVFWCDVNDDDDYRGRDQNCRNSGDELSGNRVTKRLIEV
ncbi:hypothetical protein ACOMHN_063051 [Nucella lapillus]